MVRNSVVLRKNPHIFGLLKFRSPSLFPPNYFSRIVLNYDFIYVVSYELIIKVGININIVSYK